MQNGKEAVGVHGRNQDNAHATKCASCRYIIRRIGVDRETKGREDKSIEDQGSCNGKLERRCELDGTVKVTEYSSRL